ncbi:hypothetical protein FHS83_000942 [Rhizomicrobium palustre]|uniref:Uncharacterized protein n=1 Tax=Rhizomicrobium palustre TaxID=189966 RepID=A0A846MVV0_9PROT|nr:hypothetical protein [Rhizomicrobium palustre]NIK87624.1 hypothetical protein [Rhizomicrobium palustre]
MPSISALTQPDETITVLPDGQLQIREATFITVDGEIDPSYPPRYHRYVLVPGDDLSAKSEKIKAIAAAVWSDAVIAAYRASLQTFAG